MMKAGRKNGSARLEEAAAFLGKMAAPSPSSHLREYGLQRVFARADTLEGKGTGLAARHDYRNPALLRRMVVVILAVLLFMVASTTGAYALSYDAQPGSALYGTKIFFERARIAFATSSAEDAKLEMDYSDRRMQELQGMVASGNEKGSDRWLREYLRNIEGAGALIVTVPEDDMDELRQRYQNMLENHAHTMAGMRHGQPSGLSQSIECAYGACENERVRMRQGHGHDGEEAPSQMPGGPQQEGSCPSMDGDAGEEAPPSSVDPQPMDEQEQMHDPSFPEDSSPAPDPMNPEGGQEPQGPEYGGGGMQERGPIPQPRKAL